MRSGFKTRRQRSDRLAWLFLAALLLIAGLAAYTFYAYRSAAIELLIERDRQVTYLSAARLRNELTKFSDALMRLARTQRVSERNLSTQSQALQQALPVQEGLFDGGVVLLDNFGRVVAVEPARPEIIGQDWSDRDYFHQLLRASTAYYSNAVEDGPDGAQVIVVSVPVLGEDSRFLGVLVGMLRLGESTISPFYASIVRLRIGQGGNTYVVDGKGTILFDSGSEGVGHPFSTYALPDLVFDQVGGALRTRDTRDHEIVAAYAPIPGTPWTLVIEDDWNTLTQDTRRYVNLMLILWGAGLFLPVAGVVSFLTRRISGTGEIDPAEQETAVTRQIQSSLLPEQVPVLPDWVLSIHHQPAHTVGGDFHDLMLLPDGRLMLTIGDLNDRGLSAVLLLATARATLRGTARCLLSPVQALERSNEFLCPELPLSVSVNCLYGLLDPTRGKLQVANAGHNPIFHRYGTDVAELGRAGTPLGSTLDSRYEEVEAAIAPGEYVLLYPNRLVEAPDARGEMFGLSRLKEIVGQHQGGGEDLIAAILAALQDFAGDAWEQENGVTLIVLERLAPETTG